MALYATSSPSPAHFGWSRSQPSSPIQTPSTLDDNDDFLSSDFDVSFASTMSITSAPPSPVLDLFESFEPIQQSNSPVPMDISSPAPEDVSFENDLLLTTRRRSSTLSTFEDILSATAGRSFGREISNSILSPTPPPRSSKPVQLQFDKVPSFKSAIAKQKPAFSSQWLQNPPQNARAKRSGGIFAPPSPADVSLRSDAMDVDLPSPTAPAPLPSNYAQSPLASNADFAALFYQSPTSETHAGKKRRSPDPEPEDEEEEVRRHSPRQALSPLKVPFSSSPPPSSPSVARPRPFERAATFGGANNFFNSSRQQTLPKRPLALRRPQGNPLQNAGPKSAHPALGGGQFPPPVRRAFSAQIKPGGLLAMPSSDAEDETEAEDSFLEASPAQRACIARRENVGRLGRRQHTLIGGIPPAARSPRSPRVGGLPGFGDNEADGKILPCKRVRDDGLMRIKVETLNALMDGVYDSQVSEYRVIDCRFDYEYEGGHIPGAINLNTNDNIEAFLLDNSKPAPSRSGDGSGKKLVLVFHCEFSAKRAPTFAKHLRSADRALNHHLYPKIHYPEVYILEGGYSQYYKESKQRCTPQAYVRMDDPAHLRERASDLNQFRRWERAQSFTFGERPGQCPLPTRPVSTGSTSAGPTTLTFAAASAALGRRGGANALSTLEEDADSSFTSETGEGSPCAIRVPSIGTARRPLGRAYSAMHARR